MTDPVDAHFEMVDRAESIRRMRRVLECLGAAGIDFVVEGGWAVAAYGSTVPSIDLDVLLPRGLAPDVADAIEAATGLQVYSQSALDALAMDFVDARHANPLIDRPELAYVPADLLRGRTERRSLDAGGMLAVTVPAAGCLAFMKLKAFHDRLLQWRAARGERFLLAGMAEADRDRTMRRGEAHWLRKAGKDLFDASYLCRDHTTLEQAAARAPPQMWPPVREALRGVPLPVRAFAADMAGRAGCGDVPLLDAAGKRSA